MKYSLIFILIVIFKIHSTAQVVVDPKGTRFSIDTSQWKKSGNDIYNKNNGKIGIGTSTPSAQLHTTGDVRFAGIGTSNSNSKILTSDASGNITTRLASDILSASGGRTVITLNTDVINNNATANTLQDVGLSFNIIAGNTYRFNAIIPYTSEQTNNGSRWLINVGTTAPTYLYYVSKYSNGDLNETSNWCNFISFPTVCNQNSTLGSNIAILNGVIKASVNGTIKIQFASAAKNVAITAKAGAILEYW
jgi:hypothetical protein